MPKILVGMGLPGSGKSTLLSRFAKDYDYEYLPLDQIRERLGIDNSQSSTDAVFNEIVSQTLGRYREGKTVVLDGTFLNDMRKKFLDVMRENGVQKIHGILMDTPEDVAWERVLSREKDFEDKTTRELFDSRAAHKKTFPPSLTDGFDSLFTLDADGKLSRADRFNNEERREFRSKSFLK